jgi:hypothetical protein
MSPAIVHHCAAGSKRQTPCRLRGSARNASFAPSAIPGVYIHGWIATCCSDGLCARPGRGLCCGCAALPATARSLWRTAGSGGSRPISGRNQTGHGRPDRRRPSAADDRSCRQAPDPRRCRNREVSRIVLGRQRARHRFDQQHPIAWSRVYHQPGGALRRNCPVSARWQAEDGVRFQPIAGWRGFRPLRYAPRRRAMVRLFRCDRIAQGDGDERLRVRSWSARALRLGSRQGFRPPHRALGGRRAFAHLADRRQRRGRGKLGHQHRERSLGLPRAPIQPAISG